MTKRLPQSLDPERDAIGRRRRHERGERVIDLFAEALAEHGTVTLAAAAIGIRRDYGKRLLLVIRQELGPQAC